MFDGTAGFLSAPHFQRNKTALSFMLWVFSDHGFFVKLQWPFSVIIEEACKLHD